ncbi:hypothetical protein LGK97_06635 [Clostridium sp. CS001]|uniref:hypothetical protein n=1 Tax=Clostridium sp. CS001 TaxID=2880648 RepID=UPI001CF5E778|nr:hypothetical protein [Clostridium sp. CS001]MCB2289442.1 hypothetical protein [Clostridium sp. CS001]
MKKKLLTLLTCGMLTLGSLTTVAHAQSNKSNLSFNGDTIMHLDAMGSMLQYDKSQLKDKVVESKMIIKDVSYEFPNTTIEGEIDYLKSKESTPFKLEGNFENRGIDEDKIIIGDLVDEYNNFEVINCSISKPLKTSNLFDKEKLKTKNSIDSILTIYLLEKSTRNYTSIEIINPSFFNSNELFNKIDSLEKADTEDILWHSKLLKVPGNIDSIENQPSKINTLMASYAQQKEEIITYTNDYTYSGKQYREKLDVSFQLTFDTPLQSTGWGSSRIQVLSKKTEYLDGSGSFYNDCSLSIGRTKDTTLKVALGGNNYEGFVSSKIDGSAYEPWFVDVSCDVSYGISVPNTPLNFTLTLTPGGNIDIDENFTSYYNSVSTNKFTKLSSNVFAQKFELRDIDHHFVTNFAVTDFDSAVHTGNQIGSQYIFNVYCNSNGISRSYARNLSISFNEQ